VPTVKIDDRELKVEEEIRIIEAAKQLGIWIPTLCYIEGLTTSGSCRLCMVEVVREDGKAKLVTACNYPIREDITVRVSSKRAVEARRGVMELLLARSPENPELHALAHRMGVEGTPYPTVTESQRDCILCGLCVKVCEEAIGSSAIGYTGRGTDRTIATPFRLASEECIACGACAAVCPVGTIQVRIHEDTGEAEISPFKSRAKLLVCEDCGRRMVTEPVGVEALKRTGFDWEEFRLRARLCPVCRRKRAAESLALVQGRAN
jgi:bidirectional [NiFe] hydrogenase diaphorase subunit